MAPSEDLLAWKGLSLRGLSVALDPAKATRVDVKQTVLTDFFARVIITPDGRINLQDLVKPGSSSSTTLTHSTTLTVAGTTANPASVLTATTNQGTIKTIAASNQKQWATALKDPQKALESAPGTPTAAAPPALINFGPVSLLKRQVAFSVRFVKPNVAIGGTPSVRESQLLPLIRKSSYIH